MNLHSTTISMRLIEENDAEFVVGLRTDNNLNRFLSAVGDDIEAQKKWIRSYKIDEAHNSQFYFIIERNDGVRCGTVRIYDIQDDSFSWGSWILNDKKTRYAAIESAFLVYKFGFENLGFSKCHFEVMKGNDRVMSFHEKMGAKQVSEDETFVYYNISKESVEMAKDSFGRILNK
ncbi:N-acetyltransferase [Pseudomonas putida]|nr:N-acetyltransferase [Pseudomonas putida]